MGVSGLVGSQPVLPGVGGQEREVAGQDHRRDFRIKSQIPIVRTSHILEDCLGGGPCEATAASWPSFGNLSAFGGKMETDGPHSLQKWTKD